MSVPQEPEPTATVRESVESVRMRRAPKYGVFLVLGALAGILVAMILTFAFTGTSDTSPNTGAHYSNVQVFGFVALVCAPIGMVLGAVVALILDRLLRRRAREVRVDHKRVHFD